MRVLLSRLRIAAEPLTCWVETSNAVTVALLVTIFGGIAVDALARPWSQAAADLWAWGAYLFLLICGTSRERKELSICLAIATLGETFLGFVWGLYEYRLHNLPLFIPAGHGVVFAAGRRISRNMPGWLPGALAAALAPLAVAGFAFGYDTQASLWFGVFLLCLLAARERRFPATMFALALLIETLGTSTGSWQYFSREPWFGLTTLTRPPLWAGTYYCALDILVAYVSVARAAPAWRRLIQVPLPPA
ncbi:MAG: hypothetical protein ABSB23_18205 [Bryobacteraceae bacterium]